MSSIRARGTTVVRGVRCRMTLRQRPGIFPKPQQPPLHCCNGAVSTPLDGIFDAIADGECPFDGGRLDYDLKCGECGRLFRATSKSVSWTSPGRSYRYAEVPRVPEQPQGD